MHDIIKVPRFIKEKDIKRVNDYYAESRKFMPPPGIYDVTQQLHTTKTYKIYQTERKTLEEVKIVNKRGVPPPGTYNPELPKQKIIGPIKSTTSQG